MVVHKIKFDMAAAGGNGQIRGVPDRIALSGVD